MARGHDHGAIQARPCAFLEGGGELGARIRRSVQDVAGARAQTSR